jgi:hypothetical protein
LLENKVELTEDDFEENSCKTNHMIDYIQLNALLSNVSSSPQSATPKEKLQHQLAFSARMREIVEQAVTGNFTYLTKAKYHRYQF